MAITRLGFCGPSAAYPGFTAKAESATGYTGSRYRYGYRLSWSALWFLMLLER